MEEMKLVGYRQVDFEDGGKHITGVSLYVVHPDVGVVGELAEKLFLSSDRLEALGFSPVVGSTISITWGRYNKIIAIIPSKSCDTSSFTRYFSG